MCTSGITRQHFVVKVAVVRLDVPVDVLRDKVAEKSMDGTRDADLGKCCCEERHEEHDAADQHRDLR